MSATAERTLPLALVLEEEESGVDEEEEGETEAAEERRAVVVEPPFPCSPSPRCGLRSSSEGSRRFLERERERFFVVVAFSVSLFDDDEEEEAAAATTTTTPPPRRRRCKDRDRSGPSRASRPWTARGAEATLAAFSTRGRARTGSAERGARSDAPTRRGRGGAARAQQHFCDDGDAIARTLGVAMARVCRGFSHARRQEKLFRKPLRARDAAQEPEKGSKFDAKCRSKGFFLVFFYFPRRQREFRASAFFFSRVLVFDGRSPSSFFPFESSTAKKQVRPRSVCGLLRSFLRLDAECLRDLAARASPAAVRLVNRREREEQRKRESKQAESD